MEIESLKKGRAVSRRVQVNVRVEISMKVDEINEFCLGVGASPGGIVDIAEKELGNGTGVYLEQGLFNKTK